jgi:hypothetical protein
LIAAKCFVDTLDVAHCSGNQKKTKIVIQIKKVKDSSIQKNQAKNITSKNGVTVQLLLRKCVTNFIGIVYRFFSTRRVVSDFPSNVAQSLGNHNLTHKTLPAHGFPANEPLDWKAGRCDQYCSVGCLVLNLSTV